MIWIMTDDAWAPVAQRVQTSLDTRGTDSIVIDPVASQGLAVAIDGADLALWLNDTVLDLPEAVLYLRDPIPFPVANSSLEADETCFITRQWQMMFRGLMTALQAKSVPVLNPVSSVLADEKTAQLISAAEVGFTTPATLHGACGSRAARFAHNHANRCATKPFAPFVRASNSDASMHRLLTNLTNADNLRRGLDSAAVASPTIVQPFINAPYEHRVVVVGDRVFSARTAREGANAIDVRRLSPATANVIASELPPTVARRCIELVRKSGLSHATIDLLETDDNDFVFLELDADGHFLWVEQVTGAAICDAVAELLINTAPPAPSAACRPAVLASAGRI